MTESLTDRLNKLRDNKNQFLGNKQVQDWYEQRFRQLLDAYDGASHAVNLAMKEFSSQHERVKTLEARVEKLERERDELSAANGKLQMDVLGLAERVDKMSQWVMKDRKKQSTKESSTQ